MPPACRDCDGRVARFRLEQAHTDQPTAVVGALDRVPAYLELADDRGGEVNPARAKPVKHDLPVGVCSRRWSIRCVIDRLPPSARCYAVVPYSSRKPIFVVT